MADRSICDAPSNWYLWRSFPDSFSMTRCQDCHDPHSLDDELMDPDTIILVYSESWLSLMVTFLNWSPRGHQFMFFTSNGSTMFVIVNRHASNGQSLSQHTNVISLIDPDNLAAWPETRRTERRDGLTPGHQLTSLTSELIQTFTTFNHESNHSSFTPGSSPYYARWPSKSPESCEWQQDSQLYFSCYQLLFVWPNA